MAFYRSKHELGFVYKVRQGPHVNTIELGEHGRYRTNVWDYAGINSFGADERTRNAPDRAGDRRYQGLVARGAIVLDPFSGRGTTIMAAQKSRRRARAIELDPLYVDIAIRRVVIWKA